MQAAGDHAVETWLGPFPDEIGEPAAAVQGARGEPDNFAERAGGHLTERHLGDGPPPELASQIIAAQAGQRARDSLPRAGGIVVQRRVEAIKQTRFVQRPRGLLDEGRGAGMENQDGHFSAGSHHQCSS